MLLSTTLSPNSGLTELLIYLGIGLVVVLSTLAMLSLICFIMGSLFKRADAATAAGAAKSKAQTTRVNPPTPAPSPKLDPVHAAIIAATVATVVQERFRIASVRHVEASSDWTRFMLSTWSVEGRAAIFSSHRPR